MRKSSSATGNSPMPFPPISPSTASRWRTQIITSIITRDCMSQPNRAILLTAPGVAAIAVVRLVGPPVKSFLDSHFSQPVNAGRPVHGKLSDGDLEIDDP